MAETGELGQDRIFKVPKERKESNFQHLSPEPRKEPEDGNGQHRALQTWERGSQPERPPLARLHCRKHTRKAL